jgi:hypothetical protein
MLYDHIPASTPFSASFGHFCGKSPQVPFHEQFTRTPRLIQSSPIKPNQGLRQ